MSRAGTCSSGAGLDLRTGACASGAGEARCWERSPWRRSALRPPPRSPLCPRSLRVWGWPRRRPRPCPGAGKRRWVPAARGALAACAAANAHLLPSPCQDAPSSLESPRAPSHAPGRIAQRGAGI